MKLTKGSILFYLFFQCFALAAQDRIADFNWLEVATLTTSEPNNKTLPYLTDKKESTFFVSENSGTPFTLECEFEEPIVISSYTLVSSYNENADPAKWTLLYSDNGEEWISLSEEQRAFPARNYPLNIRTGVSGDPQYGHKYYKIIIENNAQPWTLAELQFFGCKSNFENNITSNGGILTGEYEGLAAYGETLDMLIDNSYKKFCQTGTKSFWAEYESPEPVVLEKYSLTTAYTQARMPRTWELYGSTDGINYDLLDSRRNKNLFDGPYATHYYYIDSPSQPPVDWAECADLTFNTLVDEYWYPHNKRGKYFIHRNGEEPNYGYNYWWNAHALDIFVDGYVRTGRNEYRSMMEDLHQSILAANNESYWNTFYDDMEWMALACLRTYEATGQNRYRTEAIRLWDWIKDGWSDISHGGIAWASGSPDSKNACSNGPVMILAARLYNLTGEQEYLDWAKKIFNWMDYYIVDNKSGYVWDGYNNFNIANVYTYNIGTWIGGCLELYLITGEEEYLEKAIKSTNAVTDDMDKFSPYGILYNGENSGDGGLFKCIFFRYLSQLIMRGNLDDDLKEKYINYMRDNGTTLWHAGTMKPEMIVSKKFYEQPDGKVQDGSVQMCGVMIFELLDELKREGFLPDKNATISRNAENAYRYFRLEMQANNGDSASELGEWQLFENECPGCNMPDNIYVPEVEVNPVKVIGGNHEITFIPENEVNAYKYVVTDLTGRVIGNGQTSGKHSLSLPMPGIYLVKLSVEERSYNQKIIVR